MPRLPSVTVFIPTRNAGARFEQTMRRVASQDYPRFNILVIDTSSQDATRDIAARHGAKVHVITQDEFSHGGTRNLAARMATGDVIAFLTQDALPASREWLRNLVGPLADLSVAGVFGGQRPYPDASPMERFFYRKRFPETGKRRALASRGRIALDDIFFSNVNSAITQKLLLENPFEERLIMSEDQEWAKRMLLKGYATLYEPSAAVIHSHYYSLRSAFTRYFDSAYSLMQITDDTFRSFTRQGVSYTLEEIRWVAREKPLVIPYLLCYDFSKMAGTFLGRHGRSLPRSLCRQLSMHSYHWKRPPELAH